MGQVSKALGQGSEIKFKDKVYKLAPWCLKIQGLYEEYLERKAVEAARRVARHLSPEEGSKVLKEVALDAGMGVFSFGQEYARKSLDNPDHLGYLVWLQIKKLQPEVGYEVVQEMVQEQRDELIQAVNLGNLVVPNALNPETTTPGI